VKDELTRGEKKLLVQFEKIIETDHFRGEVIRIRKKLGLPDIGLLMTIEDYQSIDDPYWVPKNITNPPIDKYHFKYTYESEARFIIRMLPFVNDYFESLIRIYILYNKFLYSELRENKLYLEQPNICTVVDANKEFNKLLDHDNDPESNVPVESYALECMGWESKVYPIIIKIHSDATQTDIIDFIKKNWERINLLQKKYPEHGNTKIKNSKTTINAEIKTRNNFIYSNKHLPIKEIGRLLANQGIFIDSGLIGKVISLKNKAKQAKS
jgi:hypothetical protein